MARASPKRIWMRVAGNEDEAHLRKILAKKHPQCAEWDFKLHQGNIIIYIPITPWNHKIRRHDPSMRYLAKRWRVVPEPGGPFRLEYMRHTGKWWPVFQAVGNLEKMAEFIEQNAVDWNEFDSVDG